MPTVSAQPYKYSFEPAATALVMIDMQRDFIEPGGFGDSLGNNVALLAAIVPTVRRLLDGCRAAGITIIHTKEAHRPDLADLHVSKHKRGDPRLKIGDAGAMGRLLVDGEPGSDFVPELAPAPGDIVIVKPGKGAFYATNLSEVLRLRGITHLLIGGVTTEVCVQTTMREANDRGYECLLVEDATESYFPQFKASVLDMVRAQGGIVGWTGTSTAILRSLKQA
jgi:nicotinamidase-related amidase